MFPIRIERKNAQIGYLPTSNEHKIHVYRNRFMRLIIWLFGGGTLKVEVKKGSPVYLSKKDVVLWVKSKNPTAGLSKHPKNQILIRLVEDICQTQLGQFPSNILEGEVSSQSNRRKTYNKEGNLVVSSKANSYLILDGLDERFALNLYNQTNAPIDCIKVSIKGGTFFIEAAEIANRLHLKKNQVLDYAKKGNLSDLIKAKKEKLAVLNQIIDDYAEKFEKNTQLKKTAITPKLLMKVIRTAGKNSLFDSSQIGFIVDNPSLKEKMIVTRDDLGKLHLASFAELHLIDKGTFGAVYPVTNPLSHKNKIIKVAVDKSTVNTAVPDSINELRNEYKILNLVHHQGLVSGIQKRLNGIFVIYPTKDEAQYGYLTKKYDMDLHDFIFKGEGFSNRNFLTAFHEVVKGVKHCHELEIVHGDIKLENILVRRKKLYLADFGGACILGKHPTDKYDKGTFTEIYWLKENQDQANAARANGDRAAFNQALKSRDVYQLGCALYEVLLNDRLKSLKRIDAALLKKEKVDPKVISLVMKMTDPDMAKRLTIEAAETELAALLADK